MNQAYFKDFVQEVGVLLKSEFHSWTSQFIWKHLFVVEFFCLTTIVLIGLHEYWMMCIAAEIDSIHATYMIFFWFFTKHIRKCEEIIQKWCICFAIRNFFGKVHFVAVIIFGNTSLVKSCGFHSSLNCQIQTDFPGKKW